MRLSQLTCILWSANSLLDQGVQPPFTVSELEAAAREESLVDLFLKLDDDTGAIEFAVQTEDSRQQIESALCAAFSALDGRFSRKVGVANNPLCFAVAIAIEAIQQQFAGARTGS